MATDVTLQAMAMPQRLPILQSMIAMLVCSLGCDKKNETKDPGVQILVDKEHGVRITVPGNWWATRELHPTSTMQATNSRTRESIVVASTKKKEPCTLEEDTLAFIEQSRSELTSPQATAPATLSLHGLDARVAQVSGIDRETKDGVGLVHASVESPDACHSILIVTSKDRLEKEADVFMTIIKSFEKIASK